MGPCDPMGGAWGGWVALMWCPAVNPSTTQLQTELHPQDSLGISTISPGHSNSLLT